MCAICCTGTLLHNIGIPVRTSPSNEAPAQPQQEKHAKRLSVSPSRSASKSVRRGRPKLTEPILIETEDGEKKLVTPEEWRLLRRRITNRMSARRQKDKRESTSGGGSRQVRHYYNLFSPFSCTPGHWLDKVWFASLHDTKPSKESNNIKKYSNNMNINSHT